MKADRDIKRLGSMRSAKPNTALNKAPTMKPIWTKLVKSYACKSFNPNSTRKDGITAVPENHKARARTIVTTKRQMDLDLPVYITHQIFLMIPQDTKNQMSCPASKSEIYYLV